MKQTDLEKLLADMSLKEKVDQMLQLSGAFYLGDENSVLTGPANDMGIGKEDLEMAGSILGAAGADTMKKLQDDYMEKQPHHIPMLFMMDATRRHRQVSRRRARSNVEEKHDPCGRCRRI